MKSEIRKVFALKRASIASFRKEQASRHLFEILSKKLKIFDCIVSFASFAQEINLWPLNRLLEQRKSLYLPKMKNGSLEVFHVTNIQKDLKSNSLNFLEPNPKTCKKIDPSNIQCILVPALAFDQKNNRIGYGKGYYDRFLSSQKGIKIGLGFKEQLATSLPCESHDEKVDQLCLF